MAFHAWSLYRHHTGRTALPATVHGPARTTTLRLGDNRAPDGELLTTPATVPDLDVSATRADDGSLQLAVVNRNRDQAVPARLVLDDPMTSNSLAEPDRVTVRDLGDVELPDGTLDVRAALTDGARDLTRPAPPVPPLLSRRHFWRLVHPKRGVLAWADSTGRCNSLI